jgi:Rieske Fe-S protein
LATRGARSKRTGKELDELLQNLDAEDIDEIQPQDMNDDEILPDPAVYDTIRFIVKDLEDEGKIDCPCHNGVYDLRFTDTGIQVYCTECGATYDFKAATPTMSEEYLDIDEIILK